MFMKKFLLVCSLILIVLSAQSQIIINEVQANAGNNEGNGGEWIELKNIGASTQNMSCWKITNGGSFQVSIPAGLTLGAGKYLLIGDASKMMCPTCDFNGLNSVFTLNTAGYGPGSGAYANTVFLNVDLSANGGCSCMNGTGALNNGTGLGDRIVVTNDVGAIQDAMMYSGGDYYGAGALNVNFNSTASCPPLPAISIPATTDAIFIGKTICNDLFGCNSSYARLPDGNNGSNVTWTQTGNLNCAVCPLPCPVGAANTASEDNPTPGLPNSSNAWTATLNTNPVTSTVTNLTVCGATPLTFEYKVNNYIHTALTALQASGNYGSYTRTNTAAPINFTTANFNSSNGVTTLSSTVTPGAGTTTYEFVWGDANSTCTTCPGTNSTTVPNDNSSSEKECYVYHKVIVVREDVLGGTPSANCSLPGSVLVNGATGTNIQYTLQKQTGPAPGSSFVTIAGPQSSNAFAGIIDDDADPNYPNYQILVSSANTVCANPSAIVVTVPNACLGNPVCPTYATTGIGIPTYLPASASTVCAGSTVQFNVDINGVCNNGQVEVKYDYDSAFDPYTQGTSLGITGTVVGATPPSTTTNGKVFINEFVPRPFNNVSCTVNPNGSSPNSGEWVELKNAGPGSADISGWSISDGDWTATIPGGTIIAAGGYYLIGGGGTFCTSGVLPDLNVETCNCATVDPSPADIMNLTDGNEQIALFDCSGAFINGVYWGASQLPDLTVNNAMAAGCGNYITAKVVTMPALASFSNTGGGLSPNVGRSRTNTNTWTTTNNTTTLPTPKAANTGGDWTPDVTIPFGSSCPAPAVSASIAVNLPDTCSQAGPTNITLKAIYRPDPVAPCTAADVTATATYTIPSCELLTLSGDGNYCEPATAPVSITSSSPLSATFDVELSNGTNTTTLTGVTGTGPFSTSVANSGTWTISNITAPLGTCPPKGSGSALIAIDPVPVVTASPATVNACFLYNFDLNSIVPQITTTPGTNAFEWYDVPSGGSPIPSNLSPLSTTTYYASPTSGFPSYCEGTVRTPIVLNVEPLPDVPTVSCNGVTATFTPPSPNCLPTLCPGLEYSANGLNWSNATTYSSSDPGWAAWGSPSNSLVYIRNTANPACYNYIFFVNPCSAPLPATLLAFEGRLTAAKDILLQWYTSQEYNVNRYEVERSNNNASFTRIGEKQAIGNAQQNNHYNFTDHTPFSGPNYYRLKIVDEDGKYTYSNVVMVMNEYLQNQLTSIYPNPVNEKLNCSINIEKTQQATLQILDVLGHVVYSTKRIFEKGTNAETIDMSGMAKGNYVLRLTLNQEVFNKKFSKE